MLLGSASVKAARIMLVKLTQGRKIKSLSRKEDKQRPLDFEDEVEGLLLALDAFNGLFLHSQGQP